jgi:putative thiamine transport system permease protein
MTASRTARRPIWLAVIPAITVGVLLLPIGAGLLGTLLPAFGYLPAIGGRALDLAPWRTLVAYPGFVTSVMTTLFTGVLTALLALVLAVGFCALAHGRPWTRRIGGWLAPVLSTPHSAIAIGFAFLVAPSGWIVRAISPWLTG